MRSSMAVPRGSTATLRDAVEVAAACVLHLQFSPVSVLSGPQLASDPLEAVYRDPGRVGVHLAVEQLLGRVRDLVGVAVRLKFPGTDVSTVDIRPLVEPLAEGLPRRKVLVLADAGQAFAGRNARQDLIDDFLGIGGTRGHVPLAP